MCDKKSTGNKRILPSMKYHVPLRAIGITIILVLALFGWIFVIRTDVQKQNSVPKVVWTTYQNQVDGYTLQYPSDWVVEGNGPITITKRLNEKFYSLTISAEQNANSMTAKDWADLYSKNPKVGESAKGGEALIGQRTGYLFTGMSLNSGQKDMYIVVVNDKVYTMTFPSQGSLDGSLDTTANNAIARQIVASMIW